MYNLSCTAYKNKNDESDKRFWASYPSIEWSLKILKKAWNDYEPIKKLEMIRKKQKS